MVDSPEAGQERAVRVCKVCGWREGYCVTPWHRFVPEPDESPAEPADPEELSDSIEPDPVFEQVAEQDTPEREKPGAIIVDQVTGTRYVPVRFGTPLYTDDYLDHESGHVYSGDLPDCGPRLILRRLPAQDAVPEGGVERKDDDRVFPDAGRSGGVRSEDARSLDSPRPHHERLDGGLPPIAEPRQAEPVGERVYKIYVCPECERACDIDAPGSVRLRYCGRCGPEGGAADARPIELVPKATAEAQVEDLHDSLFVASQMFAAAEHQANQASQRVERALGFSDSEQARIACAKDDAYITIQRPAWEWRKVLAALSGDTE